MPYMTSGAGDRLGAYDAATWAKYIDTVVTHGQPWIPNSELEDPNGGIIHFGAEGTNEYYTPPARAANAPTDSIVQKDPTSTFFGWTAYEQAAFQRAMGATGLLTDKVRAAARPGGQYDPAVIAASDAELLAFSQSNAKVRAAVEKTRTSGGPFRGEQEGAFQAAEAKTIAKNAEQLESDVRRNLANLLASGAVFADTIPPGGYSADFLMGMLTSEEYIRDEISAANGKPRSNAEARRGKLPEPLRPGVFVTDSKGNAIAGNIPAGYVGPDEAARRGVEQAATAAAASSSSSSGSGNTGGSSPGQTQTSSSSSNAGGASAAANYPASVTTSVMPSDLILSRPTTRELTAVTPEPGGMSKTAILAGVAALGLAGVVAAAATRTKGRR